MSEINDEIKKWLIDHEKRLTRLESYIKLVAAETTLLLPIIIMLILWLIR